MPDETPAPPGFPTEPIPPRPLRIVIADDNPVVRAGLTVLLDGRDDIHVAAQAADGRQALQAAQQHRPDVVLLDVRMPGVDGIAALPYLVQVAPVMMLTYSRESDIVREALRLGAGGYLVHGEFTADQLVSAVRDIKEGRAYFTTSAANALLAHVRDGGFPDSRAGVRGLLDSGAPNGDLEHPSGPPVPSSSPSSWQSDHSSSQLQSNVSQSVPGQELAPHGQRAQQERDRALFGLSTREVEVMDLIATGMSNQQIAATCFISEKTVKNHINRIFAKLHSGSRSEAVAKWLGMTPDTEGSGSGSGRGRGRGTIGHG